MLQVILDWMEVTDVHALVEREPGRYCHSPKEAAATNDQIMGISMHALFES